MFTLSDEQLTALSLELAAKRVEHQNLDATIANLSSGQLRDQMVLQRLKKRKLALKDRIAELEDLLLPDIIA